MSRGLIISLCNESRSLCLHKICILLPLIIITWNIIAFAKNTRNAIPGNLSNNWTHACYVNMDLFLILSHRSKNQLCLEEYLLNVDVRFPNMECRYKDIETYLFLNHKGTGMQDIESSVLLSR